MPSFDSDGVEIAYREAGEGSPVLLIHGFGSNIDVNWGDTAGFRPWSKPVIASWRSTIAAMARAPSSMDKADYAAPEMAEDARRLLDRLGIAEADVMGYSMGARIAAFLAIAHPSRVRRLVLAGTCCEYDRRRAPRRGNRTCPRSRLSCRYHRR